MQRMFAGDFAGKHAQGIGPFLFGSFRHPQ